MCTNPNAPNLCNVCNVKPKRIEGNKTHPYCSKRCAANGDTSTNLCIHCHKQPKFNDGTTIHPFCGRTCAQKAKNTQNALTASPTVPTFRQPGKSACLLCGNTISKGHFCSKACASKAESMAPLLLEVPHDYNTFHNVADQFKTSWRHPTTCPTVRKVYKVISDRSSINKYEAYRDRVEARGNFTASSGCSPGNEKRRWYGTTRDCLLGNNGNTTLCSSSACSLCRILETSYSLKMFGKNTQWGRFGVGIYTSSTSSKSDHYSSNRMQSKTKAILLNKVVVGKGYKATQNEPSFTAPPPGYDSVIADVRPNGPLNYDELVCYTENAIRPSYLVVYDA